MATKYWIGGVYDSNASWSLTSGGPGGAGKPSASDDVVFDSGGTGGACTSSAINNVCKSLTVTSDAVVTSITTTSYGLTVAGNLTLGKVFTFAPLNLTVGADGAHVDFGGNTIAIPVSVYHIAGGNVYLDSDFTSTFAGNPNVGYSGLSVNRCTLHATGRTITVKSAGAATSGGYYAGFAFTNCTVTVDGYWGGTSIPQTSENIIFSFVNTPLHVIFTGTGATAERVCAFGNKNYDQVILEVRTSNYAQNADFMTLLNGFTAKSLEFRSQTAPARFKLTNGITITTDKLISVNARTRPAVLRPVTYGTNTYLNKAADSNEIDDIQYFATYDVNSNNRFVMKPTAVAVGLVTGWLQEMQSNLYGLSVVAHTYDTYYSANTTPQTVNIPATLAGDIVVIIGGFGNISVTFAADFTRLTTAQTQRIHAAYKVMASDTGTTSTSVAITPSSLGAWQVLVLRGWDSPTFGGGTSIQQTNTTTPDPPSQSVSGTGPALYIAIMRYSTSIACTLAAPSGYYNCRGTPYSTQSGNQVLVTARYYATTASEDPPAFETTSAIYDTATIGIRGTNVILEEE